MRRGNMVKLRSKAVGGAAGLTIAVGIVATGCFRPLPTVTQQSSPFPVSPTARTVPTASQSPSVSVGAVATSPLPSPAQPLPSPSPSGGAKSSSILGKIRQDLSEKVAIARQDSGKTYLSSALLSEQAEKLVKGRFNPDLKRLSADISVETNEYRLEVQQANASQAVIVAIAKQPGVASYVGVVYAVEDKIPVTKICKTNVPSKTPPLPPKLEKAGFVCRPGSATAD